MRNLERQAGEVHFAASVHQSDGTWCSAFALIPDCQRAATAKSDHPLVVDVMMRGKEPSVFLRRFLAGDGASFRLSGP
jgi:hypothetical protein